MWWEEFEHGNPALKGKSNVQIGDFFPAPWTLQPLHKPLSLFFNYGPPLDNQNMWQLISFDPSLDNSFSHLMIIHGFLFFLFLPDNPQSPTFVTPELPPRTEHLVRSSTPKSFIRKVRVTHPSKYLLPPFATLTPSEEEEFVYNEVIKHTTDSNSKIKEYVSISFVSHKSLFVCHLLKCIF